MRKMLKYKLEPPNPIKINVVESFIPTSVGFQGEDLFLWGLDPDVCAMEEKTFVVFGTGDEIPDTYELGDFIGHARHPAGLEFHVWELTGFIE